MELEKGESVILNYDGTPGFRMKLYLTNKRLFVLQGKGLLRVKWEKAEEIPIQEISEAYAKVKQFATESSLMLKLKSGETKQYHLGLSNTQLFKYSFLNRWDSGADMAKRMKYLYDRWVTAINQLVK